MTSMSNSLYIFSDCGTMAPAGYRLEYTPYLMVYDGGDTPVMSATPISTKRYFVDIPDIDAFNVQIQGYPTGWSCTFDYTGLQFVPGVAVDAASVQGVYAGPVFTLWNADMQALDISVQPVAPLQYEPMYGRLSEDTTVTMTDGQWLWGPSGVRTMRLPEEAGAVNRMTEVALTNDFPGTVESYVPFSASGTYAVVGDFTRLTITAFNFPQTPFYGQIRAAG